MKTINKQIKRIFYSAVLLSGMLILSDCNKALTEKSVEKKIAKAQRTTEKAKQQSSEALEARKALFMDNRQAKINEVQSRVDKIDERIATLGNISETSPNQAAVQSVNSASSEFEREKAELNAKINQIKSVPVPNWDATMRDINQSLERVESELNKLDKSLESQQAFK